jgi:hypothetical protein
MTGLGEKTEEEITEKEVREAVETAARSGFWTLRPGRMSKEASWFLTEELLRSPGPGIGDASASEAKTKGRDKGG